MTDIEQEAWDLLNAVRDRDGGPFDPTQIEYRKALCEALERAHAAEQALKDHKRKVSDAIYRYFQHSTIADEKHLCSFILSAPIDPRIAALREWLKSRGISDPNDDVLADDFARLEAVLAEHGGKITFEGEG